MKLKNSNGDKPQKFKQLQNSLIQLVTKLKNSNCEKIQNSNCDKTKKT